MDSESKGVSESGTPVKKLFPFQKEGVKALCSKVRFLIASDPGLGKTIQLIVACGVIGAKDILVLCPKSMKETWRREVAKWGKGENWEIVNHDKLITKAGEDLVRKWDVVIADESHQYLKNGSTQRAKKFIEVIEGAGRVWLSTATPASKSAEDYYLTLKVLLPDVFGKMSKSAFIERYCNKVVDRWCHSGFKYEGFKNTGELKGIFKRCAIKHRQHEVAADLPELTYTPYWAEVDSKKLIRLSEEQAEDIRRSVMEDKLFGADYNGVLRHNALLKVPSVVDLLEGYPEDVQVVVFAWHKEVVAELHKVLSETRRCSWINGEVSESDRQDRIDRFQKGELNTLVLNMQAGGVGITLTAATKGVYVQFPYSAIHWIQSQKRVHRIGSKQPVEIVKVMIKGSIDEDVFGILQERVKQINKVGV